MGYVCFLWLFTASMMNAKTLSFDNYSETMSSMFTIVSFCFLAWIMILTPAVVLFNPIERLETDVELRSCYGTVFIEFKPSKPAMLYYTFYLIRRIIYGVLLAFREGTGSTQVSILVCVCGVSLVYHVMIFPFKRKVMNILACVNEILITIIFACLLKFTSLDEEADDIDLMGWIVISMALAIIVVNTVFMVVEKLIHLYYTVMGLIHKNKIQDNKKEKQYKEVDNTLMDTTSYLKDNN